MPDKKTFVDDRRSSERRRSKHRGGGSPSKEKKDPFRFDTLEPDCGCEGTFFNGLIDNQEMPQHTSSAARPSKGHSSSITPKSKIIPVSQLPTPIVVQTPAVAQSFQSSKSHTKSESDKLEEKKIEEKKSTASENAQRYIRIQMSSETDWWRLLKEIGHMVQSVLIACALMMYYLIYSYTQLVYYTVRSLVYFHNADGAMKLTIGITIVTGIVVCISMLHRFQKMLYLDIF